MKSNPIFILFFCISFFVLSCSDAPHLENTEFVMRPYVDISKKYQEGVSLTPTLKWNASLSSNPNLVVYDVLLDIENPPKKILVENILSESYTLQVSMEPNTIYYWKVISRLGEEYAESDVYSFKTIPFKKLIEISEISIKEEEIVLEKGKTYMPKLSISPRDATFRRVHWYSKDDNIAKVTQKGQIIAINSGNTVITVSTMDKQHRDFINIVVAH